MIVQDSGQSNDTRYRLTFWDGRAEHGYFWGRYLISGDKYFAVYTRGDKRWCAHNYEGELVLEVDHEETKMDICGNFLTAHAIGNHSLYSLCQQKSHHAADHRIFDHQQLIFCSAYDDFALCANMQSMVQTYYRGNYHSYGLVETIDFYDSARLFALKRNGKFAIYRFNGEPFAPNLYPSGADFVAYNETDNTLLIGTNGVFRFMRV